MTWPPTLADDPALVRQHQVDPDEQVRSTTTVRAPCCGRVCAADMVEDWRQIPGTLVRPGGQGTPVDLDWGCDGCRSRMIASDASSYTRSDLMEAQGAPWEDVRLERAKERAREARKNTPRGFRWDQAMNQALSNLPEQRPL